VSRFRFSNSMAGIATLLLGLAFCILLFVYGVTQEVPVGQLEGNVVLSEDGKPLPGAEVTLTVPDNDEFRDRMVETDSKGHFRFRNVKVGEYVLQIYAQEHTAKATRVTVTEGHPTHFDLKLTPNDPYLKIYASQRVWAIGDDPQVELHGFRAGDVVNVEVDRVGFRDLLNGGNFMKAVAALRMREGFSVPESLEKYSKKELEFRHKVKNKDSEGAFVEPINISNLPEGFYWVKCSGNGTKAAAYINVTNIALVTKTSKGHALAYVTDLMTGVPVKGAKIWSQASASRVGTATTDSDGLAETTYTSAPSDEDMRACIMAVRGQSTGVVGIYTSEDSESSGDAKFVLYTERPIYRPGDDVQFKGIVRRRAGSTYLPPVAGTVNIQINDTDDEPIAKFPVQVSEHGSFSGHFTTSKEAGPGLYRIVARGFGSRGSHFVSMVAYRKPEMTVQVKSQKPFYMFGDKAAVKVQCAYYFGGPVVGAKLNISVFKSASFDRDPDDDSPYGRGGYGGGEFSKTFDAVTDEKGQAIVEFDTRQADDKSIPLTDADFNIEVSATDQSNKIVSGNGTVHVSRGAYDLTATSQNYLVSPGGTIDLLVRTRSIENSNLPVPRRSVSVQVSSEEWQKGVTKLISRGDYQVVTGEDGVGHVAIPATVKGSLRFKAYSRDDGGRVITAEDRAFVMGGKWEAAADESRIEVVLDKRRYKMGESAKVMVRTIAPGGSALLTVQSDRVLWHKVVPLVDMATFVDLPVDPSFMPNCFVTVAYVHKKKFYEGQSRLTVEPGKQRLTVSVQADKPEFEPGGIAHLTVHTVNSDGAPVPADVSLGVVDESIYALKEDDFNVFESFYPKRTNSVTTSYSFAEVYLDGGDKGGANVTIRRKFRDTAAWIPSVMTDKTGIAHVTVELPDNLTEWRTTAIGVTDDTSVGETVIKFKARKKLMVRLEMPEFLVQQDERQMVVMVTNDTGVDRDVHVSLAAKGVSVLGDLRQTVHVAADKPAALTFNIKTGQPGSALLTAKAWTDGGPSDGVEQGFPVLAHGVPFRQVWADEVTDAKDYTIKVGNTVDPSTGRVKVSLSGSLAGNLVSSLDGLIGFPYGCVEQTMSRFMPSVLVAKTVRDLGLPTPKLERQILKIASDSMVRLARMQHEDGGWGWWQNDKSDPFMTALVLDGTDRCKRAGFPIRKVNLDKAIEWCIKRTQDKEWGDEDIRSKAYVVYALARYGKVSEAKAAYNSLKTRTTSPADRATLVLATNELGPDFRAERDRLLDRLTQLAHQGPLGAYWDSSDWDWGSESTALALTAYMTVRPTDPIVPRIVRYLVAKRKGDMWDSTRDTSYSLVGLTMYLAQTHDLLGAFDAKVIVEGRTVKTIHIDAKNPDMQAGSVEIPLPSMHPGPNTVRVEKVGTGSCYTVVDFQGTEIQPQIAASQPIPGLKIERKYYRMEARKLEDGTMMLLPTKRPVTWAESGDTIRVELTIQSNKARSFIMVEEPTPSNCRVTDREELDEGEEWSFWWDRLVIRDEKVAFFVRNLQEGKQVLTYTMKAEGLGLAHALPTTLANMYDETQRASGAESLLEVK